MPRLAKKVEVILRKEDPKYSIVIEGEEFPYYISEEGVRVAGLTRTEFPNITITIPVEEVIVHDNRFVE